MKNKRTCDYIAEAIQNEILSGRMEAGQPLRQEELSEKLGYSRMPVREALQILEEQGLVRRLATRHVVVADFSESASTRITRMVLSIYLIVLCFLIPLTGGICGIGCVISAGVVFGYYYRMAMKNFGGVTGDLCGYFLQVCELVMALVVVVVDIIVKSGIIK